jgi:hypothetical protein
MMGCCAQLRVCCCACCARGLVYASRPCRREHSELHEAQRIAGEQLAVEGRQLRAVFAHADVVSWMCCQGAAGGQGG